MRPLNRTLVSLLVPLIAGNAAAFDETVTRVNHAGILTKHEEALVEEALPMAVRCIIKRTPKKCGIKEFHVGKFSNSDLRNLFVKPKVTYLGRMEINGEVVVDVTFDYPAKHMDALGGVIWFVIKDNRAQPTFVSYVTPEQG